MNGVWECIWKTSAGTLAIWIVTLLLYRRSAALRHSLWLSCLASFLLIPALLPLARRAPPVKLGLRLPATLNAITSSPQTPGLSISTRLPATWNFRVHGSVVIALLWLVGSLTLCIRRARAVFRMRGIVLRSRPVPDFLASESGPPLRISPEIRTPLAWGIVEPLILLPTCATHWTSACLRGVLEHEREHIRRFDWLSHWLAELVCAAWWFHPFAWLARSRAAHERECACDDAVLRGGIRASEYATELLNLATALPNKGEPIMELSILSNFERRIKNLLRLGVDRRSSGTSARIAVALAGLVVIGPLVLIRAQVPAGQADVSGIVTDISGARVPGALVIASGSGGNREVTRTDEFGGWNLPGIPAGTYTVEIQARGFARSSRAVALTAGQRQVVEHTLSVGSVQEMIEVVAQGQARRPATEAASVPSPIRVGGNVQATKLIRQVKPAYPDSARAQGIEGTVLLNAVIGKDGTLLSLAVMNKLADPDLAAAALNAARQWRYEPTLLNGSPVEVVTTITVNFKLRM